jgi:hypothetical protein
VRRTACLVLLAAAAGGCGGGDDPERSPAPPARPAPSVPDGGTERGHDADDRRPRERGSVVVPDVDRTPPEPVVRLAGAEARRDGPPRATVTLARDAPFTVTVIGRDRGGGMGRARVAIRADLVCRERGSGRVRRVPFIRYVPPPQVVRVRVAPGTRIRTMLVRRVTERFDRDDCEGGTVARFAGEAWADTTNASGLDATSRHIHFRSRPETGDSTGAGL